MKGKKPFELKTLRVKGGVFTQKWLQKLSHNQENLLIP